MPTCPYDETKPSFTFIPKKEKLSVPYEDIIFFETGQTHTLFLHTASGIYSFFGTLAQITEFFKEADCFLRVGRSYLINLNHVSGQIGNDLSMSDGSIVQVPLRKQKQTLAAVENWKFRHPDPS